MNQSFDERKIVVLRSDAPDKTAKQNESDDHFRLADSGVDAIMEPRGLGAQRKPAGRESSSTGSLGTRSNSYQKAPTALAHRRSTVRLLGASF
jgi:hypothetical protein